MARVRSWALTVGSWCTPGVVSSESTERKGPMHLLGMTLAAALLGVTLGIGTAHADGPQSVSALNIEETTIRATEALSIADADVYRAAHDDATPLIPRRGFVATDGRMEQGHPTSLPAICQLIDNGSTAPQTVMLEPLEVYAESVWKKERVGGSESRSAIGGVVASGVLYYAAAHGRGTYNDLSTPYSELDGCKTGTLAFSNTSGVLLAAGAGTGIAAGVQRSRR